MPARLRAASFVPSPSELALVMIADEVLQGQILRNIVAAGGIESIVAAMNHHGTNGQIQHSACSALYNLAESAET